MANSVVDIYNLALSSIGAGSTVSDVEEDSQEAEVCNIWYEPTRKAVLRAAPWSSCTAFKRLALLASRDFSLDWTEADPAPLWAYEYAAPADMIRPRYFENSFARFDLGIRDTTHVIVTNEQTPVLAYTKDQTLPSLWDDHLTVAIANALGANICLKLTGKIARSRSALEIANGLIRDARATLANESAPPTYDFVPSWMGSRGATVGVAQAQYFYPFGPMLSVNGIDSQ